MLVGLAWLILPGLASAHSELISSSPAANASLPKAPSQISMTFSEAFDPATASVQLLDQNQTPVAGVGPPSADATWTTVTAKLPALEAGVYTVSYRVTSAVDGHSSAGIFAFLVDPSGALPAPTAVATTSSPSSDAQTIAARWAALIAGLVLFGTALFWLASGRPALAAVGIDEVGAGVTWAVLAGVAVVAFSGAALYLVLAAQPFTQSLVDAGTHAGHGAPLAPPAFPLDFAAPFGSTPFAMAMRLVLIGTGAAFLMAAGGFILAAGRRGVRPGRWASPILALVMLSAALGLAGSSLAGHAASTGGPIFAAFDWLHLVAVGAWLGTLPGLLLLAMHVRRHGAAGRAAIGAALRRHSRIAIVAAPIVAITGIANSPIVLGRARELVASDYGNLLIAKAILFSVAVAIGAANFFLVRRGSLRRTLSLVAGEVVVGALAVVVAATMVTVQPAASRVPVLVASTASSAHLYGAAGPSSLHATVTLPAPGTQQYQVSVADEQTGAPQTRLQKVILLFTPPRGSNLPPERVELAPDGEPGVWGTSGAYTPIVGDWSLTITVRREGLRDVSTSFDLPVAPPLPPQRVRPPDTGIPVPAPLAALWLVLPDRTGSWLVLLGLLALSIGLAIPEWRRQRAGLSRRRWVSVLRTGVVVLLVVAGVGVGSRALVEAANRPVGSLAVNPITPTGESVARGRDLYLANCANCHGQNGAGDGPTGVGLMPPPGAIWPAVSSSSDGQLEYLITQGVSATAMPPFATSLTESDRWDLVNYLHSRWPQRNR